MRRKFEVLSRFKLISLTFLYNVSLILYNWFTIFSVLKALHDMKYPHCSLRMIVFLHLWDIGHLQCSDIVIFYFLCFYDEKAVIVVFSIFHYQTGNFIPVFKHYASFQKCWKLSCCMSISFLLGLDFGNSRIYFKWSHYQKQNQFSIETDWDLPTSGRPTVWKLK